jgi:hypothetical protein
VSECPAEAAWPDPAAGQHLLVLTNARTGDRSAAAASYWPGTGTGTGPDTRGRDDPGHHHDLMHGRAPPVDASRPSGAATARDGPTA